MLSIFSCVCWQSICLLWRNVYLGLLPIFGLGFCFFDIELHKLLVYSRYKSHIRYMICKYFLYFYELSFHLLEDIACSRKEFQWIPMYVFNFDEVQFIYFFPFVAYVLGVVPKEPLPNTRSWRFTPTFSMSFIVSALNLGLWCVLS